MGKDSKTFICVVFHHSSMRPEGYEVAKRFYKSWLNCNFKTNLIILDNESTCVYDFVNTKECKFIRIDNQELNGGITGAWNVLCKQAVEDGADVIMGFNDDILLNDSLKHLADNTVDSNRIYVPVSNGVFPPWISQISDEIKPNYRVEVDSINGFFMCFTSYFYKEKVVGDRLFLNHKFDNGDYIDDWAGQELMLWVWHRLYKTKGVVIGDCWLHHDKLRSWKNARNYYTE